MRNRIRELRKSKGITLEKMGELVGASAQHIHSMETGKRAINQHWMERIAEALGCSPAEVMGWGDGMSEDQGRDLSPPAQPGYGPVPVYHAAMGGKGEIIRSYDVIEYVPRIKPLLGVIDGYGMIMVGDSMVPAYCPGDTVFIHPYLHPLPGAAVLVVLEDGKQEIRAMAKYLLAVGDKAIRVRQLNPEKVIEIPAKDVRQVQVIVGSQNARVRG